MVSSRSYKSAASAFFVVVTLDSRTQKFPARLARPVELVCDHADAAQAASYFHPRKRSRRSSRRPAAATAGETSLRRDGAAGGLPLQFLETARTPRTRRVGHGFHL